MKLKQLKEIVDSLVEKVNDYDATVEIWQDQKKFTIQSIGHFGIEPDMISHILPVKRNLSEEDNKQQNISLDEYVKNVCGRLWK